MASPNEISVAQLSRLVGTPECPLIVDVRLDEDFDSNPHMIPTSVRCSHLELRAVLDGAPAKNVVVVCHKGLKLSQGAAAVLRLQGLKVEFLAGGIVGWQAAGANTVSVQKFPEILGQKPSVWVCRHRPKIDRIACPWLIRRFIDANAEFLFVAPSQVIAVAERFDAIPFDTLDTFWSHRGEECTFDTLLNEFELHTEALDRLACIVRGADTGRHELAPESAGLLALSLGLSRMYKDDLQQLEAGIQMYDAFYRWARDATDERHDWPAEAPENRS